MTYNSLEPTVRDKIRRIVGDTSNNAATELFPDGTYDKVILDYTNWKYAAADMAESVAVKIETDLNQPGSVNVPGEISVSWQDRTRSLRALAIRLRTEADAEEATSATTAVPYAPYVEPVEWR